MGTMKVYAISPGDLSVGIPPEAATIDFEYWVEEQREDIREILKDAFATIFDNMQTHIAFEDEGPQM